MSTLNTPITVTTKVFYLCPLNAETKLSILYKSLFYARLSQIYHLIYKLLYCE